MQIKQQYVVGSGTLDLIYRTSANSRVDSHGSSYIEILSMKVLHGKKRWDGKLHTW